MRKIAAIILTVTGLWSVGNIMIYKSQLKTAEKENQMLSEIAYVKDKADTEDKGNLEKINLKRLEQANSQIKGWIKIPGTVIDYPILQGTDNKFYLEHSPMKEKNISGSIFMDYRNKPKAGDNNIILYGHAMKNETMFGMLKRFKEKQFWESNPFIYIRYQDDIRVYKIYSIFECEEDFPYRSTAYKDQESLDEFLERIKKRAVYIRDQKITTKDQLLTLSTCANENRLVIIAVEVS